MDLKKPEESTYLNCIRCGLCLAACPTYREYRMETASPRGRVALTRKGLEGELELSPNLYEQMYGCFACMACNDLCPVGIRPADLALSMRHVQEQVRPKKWKQWLFGGLISSPGRMELATLPLRLYEKLGIRRLAYVLGLNRLLPARLRDLEAMLPRIPQRPLRRILPEMTEAYGESRYRAGFFLGCAQSLLFADQSAATLRVLARNGCTVITPKEIECCGMPARGYGRMDLVENQARHNIEVFERCNIDYVITDCATCGSTLKEYGSLLKEDPAWAERAAAFSGKVRDISEFLSQIPLRKPTKRIAAKVTYHDPCHLRRAQQVWKEPRKLLALIEGLEFVELPEADWCCGSAGSQLITHYETSLKVLDRKIDNVASTEARILASGCPGCQMQLNAGLQRRGLPVRVVHPVTLLDEAYGGSDGQ
ncbi:MAG TPA: (Fe-S)-binding protein [Acidobacteriota bacterium]|nr:(Fe-S)-binding protein [Acidobacteriota bacterium]